MEKETKKQMYQLVVGERNVVIGHPVSCNARTLEGAKRALKRYIAKHYGGYGCGIVEVLMPSGDYQRIFRVN
jgi:ribosomal protein L16/L10AE